jgi:hypothetical protein
MKLEFLPPMTFGTAESLWTPSHVIGDDLVISNPCLTLLWEDERAIDRISSKILRIVGIDAITAVMVNHIRAKDSLVLINKELQTLCLVVY